MVLNVDNIYNELGNNLGYIEFVFENVDVIRVKADLVKGLILGGLKEELILNKGSYLEDKDKDSLVAHRVITTENITMYIDISRVDIKGKEVQQIYNEYFELENKIRSEDNTRLINSTDVSINILKRLIAETDLSSITHINFISKEYGEEVLKSLSLDDEDYILNLEVPYNEGVYEFQGESDDYVNNNEVVRLLDKGKLLEINISKYKDYKYNK